MFGRNKKVVDEPDPELATIGNTSLGTSRSRTISERDEKLAKGIDADMIDPEEINELLSKLAYYKIKKAYPVVYDPATMKPVSFEFIEEEHVRPWAASCLMYTNKIWPTICMDSREADTLKLKIRAAFIDIRASMTPEDRLKFKTIVKGAENLAVARTEDMKDSRKSLLLKIKRDEVSVNLNKIVTKQK